MAAAAGNLGCDVTGTDKLREGKSRGSRKKGGEEYKENASRRRVKRA